MFTLLSRFTGTNAFLTLTRNTPNASDKVARLQLKTQKTKKTKRMKQRITKGRMKEWRKQTKRHFGSYVFYQPTGAPLRNALDEALSVIEQFNNQDVGSAYTWTQNTAWWGAKSFSTPHYSQFGWMKFPFESCFESLRGIWVASSEGILRLYLEPWNLSLFTLFSVLFQECIFYE